MTLQCPSHRRNELSLINQLTLDKQVDSVTGRDDSLMDSLDFCYTKYLLFRVKVKCPLIFLLMGDLLKKFLNALRM